MSYRVILADPPWSYRDKLDKIWTSDTDRSSDDKYETVMNTAAIHTYGMGLPTLEDAVLFLWVTNPFLLDGTGATVCRAWGFTPKQIIPWVKGELILEWADDVNAYAAIDLHFGLGHYTRGCTEHLILATKGHVTELLKSRSERGLIVAPAREHSRKPDEAYGLIERMFDGPYLELFARHHRAGWDAVGDELA